MGIVGSTPSSDPVPYIFDPVERWVYQTLPDGTRSPVSCPVFCEQRGHGTRPNLKNPNMWAPEAKSVEGDIATWQCGAQVTGKELSARAPSIPAPVAGAYRVCQSFQRHCGLALVKNSCCQICQVAHGQAGSPEAAMTIATELCDFANQGFSKVAVVEYKKFLLETHAQSGNSGESVDGGCSGSYQVLPMCSACEGDVVQSTE